MSILRFLVLLVVAVIIGVFAVHNKEFVEISFYPLETTLYVSLFFLVFGSVLFGVLISAIILYARVLHWKRATRNKIKENEALQKELHELKRNDNTNQNMRTQI